MPSAPTTPPRRRPYRRQFAVLTALAGALAAGVYAAPPPAKDKQEEAAIASAVLAPVTGPATLPATALDAVVGPYADVSGVRTSSSRPFVAPRPIPPNVVSDAEVEASIRRGLDVLLAQFDPATGRLNRRPVAPEFEATECGLNALCAYAVLQAGVSLDDKRFKPNAPLVVGLLEGMKKLKARGRHQVYARGIRAAALAVFNREEDRPQLAEDALTLAHSHESGGFGYGTTELDSQMLPANGGRRNASFTWVDHSNTQYGVLGVWSGAESGVDVPKQFWSATINHWTATQAVNGGWGYLARMQPDPRTRSRRADPSEATVSMTLAGAASMLVAREWSDRTGDGFRVGRDPFGDPLRAALRLIESGDLADAVKNAHHSGYTLYGVERVGLASGFKFLGDNDWFRTLARATIDRQQPDGSWGNLIETGYHLLFLARGRHPILMNKLRYDRPGEDAISAACWANRPHDVDYLARHATQKLERPFNWQVVPLARPAVDWLDAPILAIGGHERMKLRDADLDKLRAFAEAGGVIFTNADADEGVPDPKDPLAKFAAGGAVRRANEFDRYVPTIAAKLFPQYKFEDLPADHPVYSSLYKLNPRPKLRGVSNGARLLLVHSPVDLSIAWQRREPDTSREAHEAGLNLFVYAAGRKDWLYRLDSPHVPDPGLPPTKETVSVARLSYAGNWSPEPGAWPRFARLFNWKTGTAVAPFDVAWQDLKPGAAVAAVTGTTTYAPTPKELAAAKAFVEAGGVLLIDDCGGGGAFAKSVEAALAATFADGTFEPITPEHPILAGGEPGMADKLQLKLRPWAIERKIPPHSAATKVLRAGKGAVVLCPVDLTSGLLGTNTWGIHGFDPGGCEGLVRNVIWWAVDGRR